MASRRSPTIQRHRLGTELRRLREQAGKSIEQAAAALECSASKVSRVETGQVRVALRDVRELMDLYNVHGGQRDAVLDVAEKARARAWWQAYGDAPGVSMVGLQAAATAIDTYEAQLVPGLLQTAAYARAVIEAVVPDIPSDQVQRLVRLRMDRQARLAEDNPPALTAVLDEAVLRRRIGTAETMRDQLQHLTGASRLAPVTIRVLEFDEGQHAGLHGSFTIFELPDPDPDVVFLEQLTREYYLDAKAELRQYKNAFTELHRRALDPEESVTKIRNLAGRAPGR